MAEEKDRVLQILEWIWKGVQIAAVLVGGVWTYKTFVWTEEPLLEQNVKLNNSLGTPTAAGDGCRRNFRVEFVNSGKSVLTIKRVVTAGFKFKLQREPDVFAKLVDIDWIRENGQEVFRKEFPDPAYPKSGWFPFIGPHRSNETYGHSFDLLLKNEAETWFYVETEIFVEGSDRPKVGGAWDLVCGSGQAAVGNRRPTVVGTVTRALKAVVPAG